MSEEKSTLIADMDKDQLIKKRTELYESLKDFSMPAHKADNVLRMLLKIKHRLDKLS